MKKLGKRIVCILSSSILFMSTMCMDANATARTLRLHFKVSETYLYKNGVSNGVGSHLNQAFNKVSSVYNAAAGIHIVKDSFVYNSDNILNTYAGECNNIMCPGGFENHCNHVGDSSCNNYSSPQHTNAQYFIDHSMEISDTEERVYTYLVGNQLCIKSGGSHKYINGLREPSYKSLLVRDAEYDDDRGGEYSILPMVMIHEIGHSYNVADHYNNPYNHPLCVWGRLAESEYVATHFTICSDCLETLRDNRDMYNC